MNIQEVAQIIHEVKPTLKPSSIKQYISSLRNLFRKYSPNDPLVKDNNIVCINFEFLKDTDKILDIIKDNHITSQRNIITSVLTILNYYNKEHDTINFFNQKVKDLNKLQTQNYQNNIVSENTNFKLKEWSTEDIEKCIIKLKLDKQYQTALMLSLIYHYLFRNEISSLRLIKKSTYDKLTDEDKLKNNFIVKKYNEIFISRGVYKTDKTHGLIKTKIDNKVLRSDILNYIKTMDDDIFFKDSNGIQMSNDLLGKHIGRATTDFKDPIQKNPQYSLGTSSINKIVIESLQLDGIEKLVEISGNRGTSIGTLLHAYYNNYNN